MAVISDLIKVHKVIDELFFEHQRALLHFDFERALRLLNAYESTLFSHMADEEHFLLPVYEQRADFPAAGAPKLYFDDHAKMRSFIELFKEKTGEMAVETEMDRVLLQLLDREAFFLRLCSHHDRREADFLYPILDALLSDKEKYELLDRVKLRGKNIDKVSIMKTQENRTRDLLAEAAEWRLISLLFDCPSKDWFKHVADLGNPVTDKKLKRAAKAAQKEASEGLFHSIFGPGGPAPGREVSYRGWVQPGYMLAELNSFYDAFSYRPTTNEVPDHVAVETGFIAYLRLKELFALENGDNESADVTSRASIAFVDDHISKYAHRLSKLLAASGINYLKLAGAALFDRVGPDKDKSKQIFLPVLDDEDESKFDCGGA